MTNPLVREADEALKEIEDNIRKFFDAVNEVLSWVPGFLSDLIEPIRRGITWLNEKIKEFWDRVNKFRTQPGNSDRLKQIADDWNGKVGSRMGDVAGDVSLDKLKTNIDWTGRGAEAYKATVPAQVDGLNGVKDLAGQLHTSLNSLANGIDNFWLALKIAFGVFVVGTIGAIAAACTVVGTPAAIAALATSAGVSIGLVTTAILAMQSFTQTIATEQDGIKTEVDNLGREWAKTNTEPMSHAGDWRVN
jgi:hypothetical protein